MSKGRASFPKGFLFGTASSSYQVTKNQETEKKKKYYKIKWYLLQFSVLII